MSIVARSFGPAIPAIPAIPAMMMLTFTGAAVGAAPAAKVPSKPVAKRAAAARRTVTPPARTLKLPLNAPPSISVVGSTEETRSAESRLASFITAMQTGHRKRASEMFSVRVKPAERLAFVTKKWLRYDPTQRRDFQQVLYFKDLQIRTGQIFQDKNLLRVHVGSRKVPYPFAPTKGGYKRVIHKKTDPPVGWLAVTMRKEDGKWRVELHP